MCVVDAVAALRPWQHGLQEHSAAWKVLAQLLDNGCHTGKCLRITATVSAPHRTLPSEQSSDPIVGIVEEALE